MEEKDLIHSARRGNLEAFNRLVLAYQDRVYNLAYYVLLDVQAAEDTTQKAFISAFQNIRQFKGGSFQVWLLRTRCKFMRQGATQRALPVSATFDILEKILTNDRLMWVCF